MDNSNPHSKWRQVALYVLGYAVALGVISGIFWFVIGFWLDQSHVLWRWVTEVSLERWTFPNGLNVFGATGWFYFLAALGFFLVSGLFWPDIDQDYFGQKVVRRVGNKRLAIALIGLSVLSLVASSVTWWNNGRDVAASYDQASTVIVSDIDNPPVTLNYLFTSTKPGSGECDLIGTHDGVETCIREEQTTFDWQARVASATAAEITLGRATDSDQTTHLMGETLTHLYDADGAGRWSAIRDGRKLQPASGVFEWDGESRRPQFCQFDGDYELNYAFNGKWGRNLLDEVAASYRNHLFDIEDVWGYCDQHDSDNPDDWEPVVVIPTVQQEGSRHQVTYRPGGLIVIKGSASGEPVITLDTEATAGEYSGPVYPARLAEVQCNQTKWAAGRWNGNGWFRDFGFVPSGVESQIGNVSEYLLRSELDGRMYWVTPMRPRATDSEQLVAYAVIPADEMSQGVLNSYNLMVMDTEDGRVVNLQQLHELVKDAVNKEQASFFNSGGALVEFLPLDSNTWHVYAERGGTVPYRIIVETGDYIKTTVIDLEDGVEVASTTDETVSTCKADIASMSESELLDCMGQLLNELDRRQEVDVE